MQLKRCRDARKGKLDLEKYESGDELIQNLKKRYDCEFAQIQRRRLRFENSPTCIDTSPRNFIMARILIENFQRPGTLYNMKMDEFKTAKESKDEKGNIKICIMVEKHKTASTHGPTKLLLSLDHYRLMEQYVRNWRPKTESQNVFATCDGNILTNSSCWSIFNDHFAKCNIGIRKFNANSWRRAASTAIQNTGDKIQMEAGSRQFSHSRRAQDVSYLNATSVSSAACAHTKLLDTVFHKGKCFNVLLFRSL